MVVAQLRRMIPIHQPVQVNGIDWSVNAVQVFLRELEFFQKLMNELLGSIVIHLESHGLATAAVAQFVFHRFEDIVRVLFIYI